MLRNGFGGVLVLIILFFLCIVIIIKCLIDVDANGFQSLRQQCTRLENRSQLVTVCGLGPQAFLNCAGFIKIDTAAISDTSTNYIEVLDGSRVHPETYEWAKKMAVDALEYDEVTKIFSVS